MRKISIDINEDEEVLLREVVKQPAVLPELCKSLGINEWCSVDLTLKVLNALHRE